MTTYYVDYANGLDTNNGLGPDASHSTNKPWKTLTKLLGAAGMSSGDVAYLSPSAPFRELVACALTSPTAETKIIGDPSNAQGFKTGGGVLVEPGHVIHTAWLTDDVTAPATTATLLAISAKNHLTFEKIIFIGADIDTTCGSFWGATRYLKFIECVFIAGDPTMRFYRIESTNGTPLDMVWDRCIFIGAASNGNGGMHFIVARGATEYDLNVLIQNCVFILGGGAQGIVRLASSGTGTGKGGGVDVVNCTVYGAVLMVTADANLSTTYPCTVYNSVVWHTGVGLQANVAGQIIEDYNYLFAGTPRTNVTAGSNSISGCPPAKSPMFEVGQSWLHGFLAKPLFTPMLKSPILNFGNSSPPSYDLFNRPRPAGAAFGASAGILASVGALERHDTAQKETTIVDAGGVGIVLVGPADQDIKVPVTPSSTTISVKARYDSNHGSTNKPQAVLLAQSEIGITAETKTMTSAVDTWETLTFTAQTPSAKGVVTVRLISRSDASNGKAFFDTLSVS